VDDEIILRQFLISNVHWAEMHVRVDPGDKSLIVRRKNFSEVPKAPDEVPIKLEYFLSILKDAGRAVKLDIKEDGLLEQVTTMLSNIGFVDNKVWINRSINGLNIDACSLRAVIEKFPGTIKQCPVDSLGHLVMSFPSEAKRYLLMYSRCGINRFSVNWKTNESRRLIVQLQNWGFDVNIYNVPDLESFIQAALLLPRSVTSYYNFPKWFYSGLKEEDQNTSQRSLYVSSREVSHLTPM